MLSPTRADRPGHGPQDAFDHRRRFFRRTRGFCIGHSAGSPPSAAIALLGMTGDILKSRRRRTLNLK